MKPVSGEDRLRLSRKTRLRWDARSERWLLLYPERGLLLNASAGEVVSLCDGRSVNAIVEALHARYRDQPKERLEREVTELLTALSRRGLLEVA